MAHKLPRKSTNIDMTAMCDVAFLLLTFFMLATKFKPAEPVVVRTPTSVADIPQPDNSILLSIDKGGKIYMDFDNKDAKKILIDQVNTDKALNLTEEEKQSFVKGTAIGASYANLKAFLGSNTEERKNATGIPCDTTFSPETNELAYWIYNARLAGVNTGKPPLICIKSDAGLQYPGFKNIIRILTKNEIFTFNLLTSSEQVPEGTALYNERVLGNNKK
jgi:biopolymer transport protein ExbD